jgi:hypothetical protein
MSAVLDCASEACALKSFFGETGGRSYCASLKVLFKVDFRWLDTPQTQLSGYVEMSGRYFRYNFL